MDHHLASQLRQLRQELESGKTSLPQKRDSIDRLVRDIDDILGTTSQPATPHLRGLRDRLIGTAAGFEAIHPELAKSIERVIEVLVSQNL